MPNPSENGGGEGELLSECTVNSIHRQAIRQRWSMRPEQREDVIQGQIEIACDPDEDAGKRTKSARCVIQAEGQNQADELKATPSQVLHAHAHAFVGIDELRNALAAAIGREAARRGISAGANGVPGDSSANGSES